MISGRQCMAARYWLGWTQVDLCQKAGLYRQKLIAFEKAGEIDKNSLDKILAAFITAGVKIHRSGSISLEP